MTRTTLFRKHLAGWAALGVLAIPQIQGADYQSIVLEDDPAGYWRLGESEGTTAANLGTLGETAAGTVVDNVLFGTPGAILNDADTAAYLDGVSAKIEVPHAPELNSGNFTVEIWAKAGFLGSGHRSPIASRDDTPVGNTSGYIIYADPNDNWQFWTGRGAGAGWDNMGGALVTRDLWTHLVGTYENGIKKFYVNGVLVGANQSLLQLNEERPLRIGASANENPIGSFFFEGDVDEAAIYTNALPEDRVLAHYFAGSGIDPEFVPPTVVLEPTPEVALFKGDPLTLAVLATGALPLDAQWTKDGSVLPGATDSVFQVADAQPSDSGVYQVTITNPAGEISSGLITVTVADITIPEITSQPRNRTVMPGTDASFGVQANGSATFDYQWRFNETDITGATNSTLIVTNVQEANLGSYEVVVSNAAGSTTSETATLQFPAEATQSYAETVQDDEPVSYWRLDDTGDEAADSAGINPGLYINGVTHGVPGALVDDPNTAAGFSAELLQKVDVPFSPDLNTTEFTIELWAKVTGGSGHRSPLTSRADFPQRGYIFYADPANNWQFWTGTETGWDILSGPQVVNDSWAHLVGVYDGTNKFFYVNGVLVGSREAGYLLNDFAPLRFGAGATEGDGGLWFEGHVDEVSYYNKALSEDRILAHYVAGFPLTTPPTIAIQPLSQLVPPGADITLSVTATGGLPLNYQWKLNGTDIAGATSSTLLVENIQATANYSVVVSNTGGTVTSETALVTVPTVPDMAYSDLVVSHGPVGYWRLGESEGEIADDLIGFNDGTYLNGVTLGVPGAILEDEDTAAGFTAANLTKLDIPWAAEFNGTVFTAEVWAKSTGGTGHRSPMTSRGDPPAAGYIFYAVPGNTWEFWTGTGSGWHTMAGPPVVVDEWVHLVGTFDGTTKRYYVNGVEIGSATPLFEPNPFNPLRIGAGASEGNGNYFFEGSVDEPAIYDKVLTHEQIIQHYLAGRGGEPTEQPTVNIARDGADILISWEMGTLQQTSDIAGDWEDLTAATSPYRVTPTGSGQTFYRVKQ